MIIKKISLIFFSILLTTSFNIKEVEASCFLRIFCPPNHTKYYHRYKHKHYKHKHHHTTKKVIIIKKPIIIPVPSTQPQDRSPIDIFK